jgi:hypothetical protein
LPVAPGACFESTVSAARRRAAAPAAHVGRCRAAR